MPLPILKTPAEFIDYYYTQLKTDLGNDNIKLSKTGFMGFLLNVLGNTQFDTKMYYDSLFTESFPSLAQDDKNLQYHATTNGYKIPLASASVVTSGVFNLNLNLLPTAKLNLSSRKISFGSVSNNSGVSNPIEFLVNGMLYTVDASYLIIAKITNGSIISYFFESISSSSQVNGGVQISSPSLPIINAKQYSTISRFETIPFYPYGSHYSITIPLSPTDMVTNIIATMTSPTGTSLISMIADTSKDKYNATSNVIFYTVLSGNILLIELGSGNKGAKVIEGSSLSIVVHVTMGTKGDIVPPGAVLASVSTVSSSSATVATVTDIYSDGTTSSVNISLPQFLSPTNIISVGGSDILSGQSLRDGIMRHIQTRDSIVSQLDYNNIISPIFQYYAISFNKSKLSDNTISLYIPILDSYNTPIKASTVNYPKSDFELNLFQNTALGIRSAFEPTIVISGERFISPFYYRYDFLFNSYFAYILDQNKVYNYSNTISYDSSGRTVTSAVSELPNITLSLKYIHNTISPYTILSLSSYEDITSYIGGFGYTNIRFIDLNLKFTTGTSTIPASSNYISNIIKHSGIQSSLSSAILITPITSISLLSTSSFPFSGSVVIGTEDFTYSGKDDITNTLTGVVRGVNNTIISAHSAGSSIFDITINTTKIEFVLGKIASTITNNMTLTSTTINLIDASLFPPSGSIIIGNEEILYSNITGLSLNNVVRGSNNTVATIHNIGDIVVEKDSNISQDPSIIAGILNTTSQIEVVLDNSSILNNTGFKNIYTFNVDQLTNINDYLQIKQYSISVTTTSVVGTVLSTDTTINASSTVGFLSNGILKIGNEEMTYTSITATSFVGITRSSNGIIASSYINGSIISFILPSELSVPVVRESDYLANPKDIVSSITSGYQSISLSANRAISDEVQMRLLNTSYISLKFLQLSVVNGPNYVPSGATPTQVNAPTGLLFPLKLNVVLVLNRVLVTSSGVNITSEIDNLMMTMAQELSNKYTGTNIRITDADMIFIAKQISYIDDANVTFTDSSLVPVVINRNEINVLPERDILSGMSKLDRIDYVPVLWHWDINNISITYTVI